MLRRAANLSVLTWALVATALVLTVKQLVEQSGTFKQLTVYEVLPWTLMMFATAAGLLATSRFRRGCAELAVAIRHLKTGDVPRAINSPANDFTLLANAIAERTSEDAKAVNEAKAQATHLDHQLRQAHAERKHAEAIIDSISDAVLVTDLGDNLILANDAAARMFGFQIPTNVKPIDEIPTDSRIIKLIREMREQPSSNGTRSLEQSLRGATGERIYRVTLSRVAPEGERPAGVVTVLHDITPERELADMKNDFVTSVSHELRTPLSSIQAYIEMLIDGEADDDKTKSDFYEVIQNEANRLSRLIDNIISVSRIESGLMRFDMQARNLNAIVRDALDCMRLQAKTKNITIRENLGETLPPVRADGDMIHQAIINILSNAITYTAPGGEITLMTAVECEMIAVEISDNGRGIPAKDLPYIFEKYYKIESNNGLTRGTGLGLSLVREVIEKIHAGTITVKSEVGKGSCFVLQLPAYRVHEAHVPVGSHS
jgi:two-component system phosphate regulon sensor histidine kinase PhoR